MIVYCEYAYDYDSASFAVVDALSMNDKLWLLLAL